MNLDEIERNALVSTVMALVAGIVVSVSCGMFVSNLIQASASSTSLGNALLVGFVGVVVGGLVGYFAYLAVGLWRFSVTIPKALRLWPTVALVVSPIVAVISTYVAAILFMLVPFLAFVGQVLGYLFMLGIPVVAVVAATRYAKNKYTPPDYGPDTDFTMGPRFPY